MIVSCLVKTYASLDTPSTRKENFRDNRTEE